MRTHLFSAIDVGSDTIKMGVVRQRPDKRQPELLELDTEPSFGIRKGVVEDPDKVTRRVATLVQRVERTLGKRVRDVVINIGGGHLFVTSSRGVVAVSRADQQISQEDIDRVVAAAQALSLPANKEVLYAIPREFVVDGEGAVNDPLGMKGIRLEAEMMVLCGFSPYLRSLTDAISRAEIDILDVVPSALASSQAVLNSQQKELGVAMLDIGAWTTDLAVYEEGELVHMAVFPVGSGHITNDIAIGLQTEIEIAEKIKLEYGSCHYAAKGGPAKITIDPDEILGRVETEPALEEDIRINGKKKEAPKKVQPKSDNAFSFQRKLLVKIITARVGDIFSEVEKELKDIGKAKQLPAGVVITGGGARLPEIAAFAKKELKLPAKVGVPRGVTGLERDPTLATLAGLLLRCVDADEAELQRRSRGGIGSVVRNVFRIFTP